MKRRPGRPALPPEQRVRRVLITLPPALHEAVRARAQNVSGWIHEAIERRLIMDAQNLEQVREIMLAWPGDDWPTTLPTFGGEEPRDTHAVWSWDETRLLVGTHAADLRIVPREEWP